MKKNKVFFGLALLGIAFSGAAFTAKGSLQTSHYIQKPGECKMISNTGCVENRPTQCQAQDPEELTDQYPVFLNQSSASSCSTPLGPRP